MPGGTDDECLKLVCETRAWESENDTAVALAHASESFAEHLAQNDFAGVCSISEIL